VDAALKSFSQVYAMNIDYATWPSASLLFRAHPLNKIYSLNPTGFLQSMSRIYRALLVVLAFEMGALAPVSAWSGYWNRTTFSVIFLAMPIVLHPSFRGVVSGSVS